MQHLQKTKGGGSVMVNQESDKVFRPERPPRARDLLPLFTPMSSTNPRKQISLLPVLTVEWGWRHGWKLPTGSPGRVAHAEEEPRLYLRGGAVAGAGHRGEHRHLYDYQRGLPAPAAGRGTLAARGNVYPRHSNDRCEHKFSTHPDFSPQLRGLPRPEHRFLWTGDGHLPHTAELGRPGGAATTERLAGERELLRRARRETRSGPHVYRRRRQKTRRQPGSGIELQLVGAAIRFRRQADRPDHHPEWNTLHGRGHRSAEFQGDCVPRPPGRALDSHQHARLCAYRTAQGSRKSPALPLDIDCRPVEAAGWRCGGAVGDENDRRRPGERVSARQQRPHRRTLSPERIGAGNQSAAAVFSCRGRADERGRSGPLDRVRQPGQSSARAGRQTRERVEHSRGARRGALPPGAPAFDGKHRALAARRIGWAAGSVLGTQNFVVFPASVSSRWLD